MAIQLNDLLWSKPGMNGGRLCAAGSGVSVLQLVVCHQRGESVAEILESYPHLSPAVIYAAWAYYYANRDEVEATLAAEAAEYERLAEEDRLRKAARV